MARRPEQQEQQVGAEPGPPVRFNPLDLGVFYQSTRLRNNRTFLSHYIAESPLTATIRFPSINIWPIEDPWNHPLLLSIASVYAEARYHYGGIANPALKRAIVAGETLSPKLPQVKISPSAEARASIVSWMKLGLTEDIFSVLGDYTNELYQMFREHREIIAHFDIPNLPSIYPWTAAQINAMTPQSAVFIMFFYAFNLRISSRHLAIENITLAYCSLVKRGQVTDEFCTKIRNSVRDELGITVNLNQPAINALYKSYMMGVNKTNAENVFTDLDALIPDVALRLKLTLQQAAGSGMTLYVIIGRAIRMYYNFPWGRVNTLTSGELVNWEAARTLVRDNLYYGFRRDMGAARSTLYKSIGYVARELLVRINGERTLLRYAGLGGNIKNKNALDRLIKNYVELYTAAEGDETEQERQIMPAREQLVLNSLFA